MKRILVLAGVAATVVMSGGVAAADTALTCYEVGVERTPSASATTAPPSAKVDDGDPYVRESSGGCTL